MEKYDLSDIEKRILRELAESPYKAGMFSNLSREELNVATKRLKAYGLIMSEIAGQGGVLAFATILDKGRIYLKENPEKVQWNKSIHNTMDFVIKFKEFVCAVIFLIGLALGCFFFFKKF